MEGLVLILFQNYYSFLLGSKVGKSLGDHEKKRVLKSNLVTPFMLLLKWSVTTSV